MIPELEELVALARALGLGFIGAILAIGGLVGMHRIERLGTAAGAVSERVTRLAATAGQSVQDWVREAVRLRLTNPR